MKIFSTSIESAADAFLHAGYVSAAPSPTDIYGEYNTLWATGDTGYATSLDGALTLADTAVADSAMTGWASFGVGLAEAAPALLGVTALAGLLWMALRPAARGQLGRSPVPAGALSLGLASTLLFAACMAPWHNLDPRQYENPEDATAVLMFGVVRDGLMAHQQDVGKASSLTGIRNHVALPLPILDEGPDYALQAYGLDGWGREMVFGVDGSSDYTLTSAGADGEEGTADDMEMVFDAGDLGEDERTFYLMRAGGELHVAVRQEPERNSNDGSYSGNTQAGMDSDSWGDGDFDSLPLTVESIEEYFTEWDMGSEMDVEQTIASITDFYETFATDDDPDPIVVQIFDDDLAS